MPGITVREVRSLTGDDYRDVFDREPFTRGPSAYWFTLAEWMVVLELKGELPLPTRLLEFARKSKILPRRRARLLSGSDEDREGANLSATEQAWDRTIQFFREHLGA